MIVPLVKTKSNTLPKIWAKVKGFLGSKFMLPILAFVVIFFHLIRQDIAGFAVLTVYLIVVFTTDIRIRASVPALLFAIFVVNPSTGVIGDEGHDASRMLSMAPLIAALGGLVLIAMVYGIIKRRLKLRLSFGLLGVLAMGLSFILGGLFSEGYSAYSLLAGLAIAAIYISLFLYCAFCVEKKDFDYFAKAIILAGMIVTVQLLTRAVSNQVVAVFLENPTPAAIKSLLSLGWGSSNTAAPYMAMSMAVMLYYICNLQAQKFAARQNVKQNAAIFFKSCLDYKLWLMLFVFAIKTFTIFLTLSRAMILFILPFVLFAAIYGIIRTKGTLKIKFSVFVLICFIVSIAILIAMREQVAYMFENNTGSSGRDEIFNQALQGFSNNPSFGQGVLYLRGHENLAAFAWPVYLVHNTALQFMMWGGMLGLLAFAFHFATNILPLCKKPTEKKMLVLMAILLVHAHSMLDVVAFYPPMILALFLMLVMLEKTTPIKVFEKKQK